MKWLNKLVDDTLKTPMGKWSRKSLMILTTFIFVLLLGTFITVSDKILDKEVNRYAIDIFNSLLLFEISLLGINEVSKKILNKPPLDE